MAYAGYGGRGVLKDTWRYCEVLIRTAGYLGLLQGTAGYCCVLPYTTMYCRVLRLLQVTG